MSGRDSQARAAKPLVWAPPLGAACFFAACLRKLPLRSIMKETCVILIQDIACMLQKNILRTFRRLHPMRASLASPSPTAATTTRGTRRAPRLAPRHVGPPHPVASSSPPPPSAPSPPPPLPSPPSLPPPATPPHPTRPPLPSPRRHQPEQLTALVGPEKAHLVSDVLERHGSTCIAHGFPARLLPPRPKFSPARAPHGCRASGAPSLPPGVRGAG